MRVLDPIVLSKAAGSVQMPQIQLIESRAVRRQPIRRHRLRIDRLVVKEPPEQLQCGLCVTPTLDQDVEDFTLVIDGAP